MNISSNTKKCLEFYVKDTTLEGFWDKRHELYKQLKEFDFKFIIAPNFSIYTDAPRIDHLYNIKRSSIVYNELLESGINAVPDISYFNLADLNQWVNQINKNNIKLIAFSFQNVGVGLKPSNIWKQNLTGLRYLCENINSDVEIILAGVVSPFRIASIYDSINRSHKLHILNQSAFVQSCKGILSETRESKAKYSISKLFKENLEYFNMIYTELYYSDSVNKLMQLPKDELIELYNKHESSKEEPKQQLTYKIIKRLIKKKHIKAGELKNAKRKK